MAPYGEGVKGCAADQLFELIHRRRSERSLRSKMCSNRRPFADGDSASHAPWSAGERSPKRRAFLLAAFFATFFAALLSAVLDERFTGRGVRKHIRKGQFHVQAP